MTTQPVIVDDKIYVFDNNLKVHCYDPVEKSKCSGYPKKRDSSWNRTRNQDLVGNRPGVDQGPTTTSGWAPDEGYEPRALAAEGRIYLYWPTKEGVRLLCFDPSSDGPCSGFGTPIAHSIPRFWPAIFENLDSSGNHNGVCLYQTDNTVPCVDENGTVFTRNDLNASLPSHWHRTYNTPLRIGNRLFAGAPWQKDSNSATAWSKTYCVDLITGASYGVRSDPQAYGYDQVPNRECVMSVGHIGAFSSFSPEDLQPCRSGSGLIEIFPCSCDGENFFWGELAFGADFLANFDSFEVTIKNDVGVVLVPETDMLDTGGAS